MALSEPVRYWSCLGDNRARMVRVKVNIICLLKVVGPELPRNGARSAA